METKHEPKFAHCSYLGKVLRTDALRNTIQQAHEFLRPMADSFDAIAFRGMSGSLLAPSLALALDKTLIMVRKPYEKNHSNRRIEGDCAARSYIIVDDQISMGDTVAAIIATVEKFAPQAEFKGVYLFVDEPELQVPQEIFRVYASRILQERENLAAEVAEDSWLITRQ
jgi:adenine/guanine phosphoribosyltransferase-like PRPP-binding protein